MQVGALDSADQGSALDAGNIVEFQDAVALSHGGRRDRELVGRRPEFFHGVLGQCLANDHKSIPLVLPDLFFGKHGITP